MTPTNLYLALIASLVFAVILTALHVFHSNKVYDKQKKELDALLLKIKIFKALLNTVRTEEELAMIYDTKYKEIETEIDCSSYKKELSGQILNLLGRINGMLYVFQLYEKPPENIKGLYTKIK